TFLFSDTYLANAQRYYVQSSQCVYKADGTPLMKRYYPCHKCGKSFTRKNNLYNHLKFQCGQLPKFNCPYCTYRTKHSSNVRSHVRRIHPDQQVYVLDLRMKQENQTR
ncbi:PREDICTED: zinc finger X-chromosomal protein-like, partial [Dinoponera quadriceps]|uniref:Zinc finger X-chromosomal protein-like n=1 Tax=Dinoponera quadriceps TaxID=609295 RepID=A0A6P3YDC5_DINQU